MGYFACAQYDVLFLLVFASVAKQSPGRVVFRKVYSLSLWSWDISLALNMTLSLRGSKATAAISREGGFLQSIFFIALVVGYFAYAQYDIVIAREQSDRGNLPGGWRSAEYMLNTLSREVFLRYFAVHIV